MINLVLKTMEKNGQEQITFLKFDEIVLKEIEMEMREARNPDKIAEIESQISSGNFDSFVEKYAQIASFTEEERGKFRGTVKDDYNKFMKSNSYLKEAANLFALRLTVMLTLLKILTTKRDIFYGKNSPTTVRLFEDGGQKFVMKSELSIALNPEKAAGIYKDREAEGIPVYFTMELEEAIEEGCGRVEFIRYPIQRTKHKASPFHGPDPDDPDDWFILAVDAFLEYMKNRITGFSFFLKHASLNSNVDTVLDLFKKLDGIFQPEIKKPYVMQVKSTNILFEGIRIAMPTDFIRNAKPDGFSLGNLRKELKYLELTRIFPEILNYAEDVYIEVDKAKKGEFLRTCDLFDAVEMCQIICVLNRVPNLKKFLHNQNGCGRVLGYKM